MSKTTSAPCLTAADQVVEMGTHRTVFFRAGKRHVVRHNPPLDPRQALDLIALSMSGRDYWSVLGGLIGGMAQPEVEADSQSPAPKAKPKRTAPTRRMLDAREARNVLNDPLLRLPGTSTDRVGGIRLRQGEVDPATCKPSLGQFRDFRDKPRSLPQLHAQTLKGIVLQPAALDGSLVTEEGLRAIAKGASQYRRQQGVTGGDCGPESVELYVRIFRALGMTAADATARGADALEAIYLAYLRVHAQ